MTKPKAYYQAYLVLQCLSKEEYSLIPKDLLQDIKDKMEVDESIKVDPNIPIEKQKIDEKAYDILDKVIRAIERAYGKDAIDNPEKYADKIEEDNSSNEADELIVEKEEPHEENAKNKKDKKQNVDSEKVKELKEENIQLKSIIDALKRENEKIDKAKDLVLDYQEIVARKDSQIRDLNRKIDELEVNNEELYKMYKKVPGIVRKIFVKEEVKMLKSGEKSDKNS